MIWITIASRSVYHGYASNGKMLGMNDYVRDGLGLVG